MKFILIFILLGRTYSLIPRRNIISNLVYTPALLLNNENNENNNKFILKNNLMHVMNEGNSRSSDIIQ